MTELQAELAALAVRALSIGFRTLHIVGPDELDGARVGYARDSDGKDLTGALSGEWQSTWVAIGPQTLGGCSVRMLLIVPDPAAVCARAVRAGATQFARASGAKGSASFPLMTQ